METNMSNNINLSYLSSMAVAGALYDKHQDLELLKAALDRYENILLKLNLHFPPNFTHFVDKTRLLRLHLILLILIVK